MKTNCADDLFLWCLLMKRKNIVYCNKLVYLHINTGENFSLDKLNGLKSDNEVLQFLRMKDGISPKFLNLFELRYKYQMSVNEKSDKKKRAALYPVILNMWKIYGVLLTIANNLVGNKVPKYTDSSMFEY